MKTLWSSLVLLLAAVPTVLWRRRCRGPHQRPVSPAVPPPSPPVVPPAPGAGTDPDPVRPVRSPELDARVAAAVLDVVAAMTSVELRRRLIEAVALLPDIGLVDPAPGTVFDPERHAWAETRPAPEAVDRDTVAVTLSVGLTDHLGRVVRPARVAVYDQEGE
ncbi:hypothetical protein [Micromonospora yangpuensis]|uniref:GrpE protein n=1 Tax=Micromonospora yangpuensis TaxID=683228 RepID=A0A1C6VGB4_9ACTN|nr:hypothetical protein [Micromonospora yangpuensis]GGL98778.1 hypothetical protein GCM10012279_15310 [Micromonospora yangpuensis]SCL65386.1 hypothetical protein GA0070617_5748 [Micromonospora yangpuensis]